MKPESEIKNWGHELVTRVLLYKVSFHKTLIPYSCENKREKQVRQTTAWKHNS